MPTDRRADNADNYGATTTGLPRMTANGKNGVESRDGGDDEVDEHMLAVNLQDS